MPIVGSDLIAPVGALADSLLLAIGGARTPAVTSASAVAQGLADAGDARALATRTWSTVAARDTAATAWAYHAAYSERAQQVGGASPASVSAEGEGARSYSGDQIRMMREEARRWAAEFDRLAAADVAAGAVTARGLSASRSVPVVVRW